MFEFIQAVLSRMPKAIIFESNSMASRHLKTTLFNFSEELECPQFPKLPLLRCQNFLKVFLPFRSAGFCLRGLGHGASASRGKTPLHFAAAKGRELVLERLIKAKAAVDGKTYNGRGLGQRILGRENLLEAMGSLREEVDEIDLLWKLLL